MKAAITTVSSLLSLFLALAPAGMKAQSPVKVSGTAIVQSAYLWRGEKVCEINFYPTMELKAGNFTAQAFAYLPFDGSYKEIDVDYSYAVGPVSLHVADYFIRFADNPAPENFFDFRKQSTNHILEGIVCFNPVSLPVAARWFTFFYGDWLPAADGGRGASSYSSYFEMEGWHNFDAGGRCSLLLGASVLKGPYTAYSEDFAFVHCEIKYTNEVECGGVTLPFGVSWMLNPYSRRVFMNAYVGVSF